MKTRDREGGSGDHHCVVKEGDSWGWNPGKEKNQSRNRSHHALGAGWVCALCGCDRASIEETGTRPREDAG